MVLELTEAAYDSAGSAADKYAKYEESIAAQQARITDLWQEFVMSADFESVIKDFLSVAEMLMKVVAELGKAAKYIPVLVTAFSALQISLQKNGSSLRQYMANLFGFAIKATETAEVVDDVSNAVGGLSKTMSIIAPKAMLIIGGITLAVQAIRKLVPSVDELHDKLAGLSNEVEQGEATSQRYRDELEELKKKIEELNSLKLSGEITAAQEEELRNLKLESKEIEWQLALEEEKLRVLKEQKRISAGDYYNNYTKWWRNEDYWKDWLVAGFDEDAAERNARRYKQASMTPEQILSDNVAYIKELEERVINAEDTNEIIDLENKIVDLKSQNVSLAEDLMLVMQSIDKESPVYEDISFALESYTNSTMSLEDKVNNVLSKEEFSSAKKKLEDLAETGELAAETLNNIEFRDLLKALSEIEGLEFDGISFDSEEQKEEFRDILDSYRQQIKEAEELGVDLNKTIYGNIDTNNRQILEWTSEATKAFELELESWGYSAEDMLGYVSTIMGSTMTFDDVDIAFTPLLQTEDGPKLLSASTMEKYLNAVLEEAGEDWSLENILKIDSEGFEIDGIKIKRMIADIGKEADKTSKAMHFTGATGSIALEFKKLEEFAKKSGISVDQLVFILDNLDDEGIIELGGAMKYLLEMFIKAKEEGEDLVDVLGEISQIDMTSKVQDEVGALIDALNEFNKTGVISHDTVVKMQDANIDLGDSLTLTKNGYVTTRDALMKLVAAKKAEVSGLSSALQAAAKLVNAKIDEKASYDEVTKSILKKIEAQKAEAQATIKSLLNSLKGVGYTGEGVWDNRNEINQQIKDARENYNSLLEAQKGIEDALKNIDKFETSFSYLMNQKANSASSAAKSSADSAKAEETAFEKEIRILEHRQYLAEQWANTYKDDKEKEIEYQKKVNEQVEIYNQLMAKTHAEANRLRALGFADTTKEIQELQKQHWEYYNAKNQLLKDLQEQAEKEKEDEKDVETEYERQIRLLEHKQFLAEQWANLYQGNAKKEAEYQEKINEQIEIYGELMEAVNEEARRKRGEGYDNESAEIQELQRKYWDYYNYRKDLIDRLYDFQKEKLEEQKRQEEEALQKTESALSELKSAINDLIDEARDRLDKIVDNLDYQISKLQAMKTLTQQYHTSINDVAKLQNDINKELAKSKSQYAYIDATLRKTLFNDADYKKLSKKLQGIADESEKLYNDYLQELSTLTEDEIYKADQITAEYKRQYELKKMEYNIAQAELNLIKAQSNLQEVLANRNVRMFQNGQWTWVADYEAVKNAQEAVEDAKYNYKQAQIEKKQQDIINQYDKMIAALEAQKQQQQAEFNALKDRWEAVQKQLTTQGDAMSRIIKIITETDLPEFRKIVGNVGGALTDIINDANAFGGGMDRVIDNIVDMIGTAADKIDDILDDLERDYGDFGWDDSGVTYPNGGNQGGTGSGSGGNYDDLYSENYLKSAIEAASRGDLDLAYRYLDKREEKVQQSGNDRGVSASQAYSMVMQEYYSPGSYTFDKYGNAVWVGGSNNSSSNSSRPSSSSNSSSSSGSNYTPSTSSGSSSGGGSSGSSSLVWSVSSFTSERKPGFAGMTITQRSPSHEWLVTYDKNGNVVSSSQVYDKGGVLEGMGGIKATPKDETVFDAKISSMLLDPRRSQEFLNSAEALTKILENVGGFSQLMTAMEAVVNSNNTPSDSHDFIFNGDIVGSMNKNDFDSISSILRRYIPITKG